MKRRCQLQAQLLTQKDMEIGDLKGVIAQNESLHSTDIEYYKEQLYKAKEEIAEATKGQTQVRVEKDNEIKNLKALNDEMLTRIRKQTMQNH